MADVSKFILNNTSIDVKDAIARSDASAAQASVTTLAGRVTNIEALARLSVSYTDSTETITFTNETHS
jgi:hypothetical protein